jgi:Protein of unknown function (DUF2587)
MTDHLPIAAGEGPSPDEGTAITDAGRLMRIAVMLRSLQQEVRQSPTDEAGRERLMQVHKVALQQLCEVLSPDLQNELSSLTLPLGDGLPTESEIRMAQAQLLGWLEGMFQGIQAATFHQQMIARQQLEHMRQGALPSGPGQPQPGTGQYL